MRTIFLCIGISTALMLANVTSLAANISHPESVVPRSKTVYGLSNAKHFKASDNGDYYIQVGTFKSIKNANQYKVNLGEKYHQPVIVKKQGGYHVVFIGPIHSAAEARSLNHSNRKVVSLKQEHPNKHLLVVEYKDRGISPITGPNHFEVIGALGIANLRAGDGSLGVTSSETDRLVQTNRNNWDAFSGQLGIGYIYYLNGAQQYSENTQWFPWIEPEINGYYLGKSNIKGDVWRFGSSAFNDMTYNMPINSYRLMFDTALTVVSNKQYSLYAIGGIGNTWNRVGYSDADRSSVPCADQHLNLNTATRSNFAWEAGGGLSYAFNNRFSLSLEYLYTDLGKITSSSTGFTGTIITPVLIPTDIKLTSQAALFGLHVAV